MADELNVKKQIDMVFSIANSLRGTYQPEKYRDVIIPMTIIRRLECALEATKGAVCSAFEANPKVPDAILRRKAGNLPFYNTSRYSLRSLLADPQHLDRNLVTYLDAFSPNIREIIQGLEFKTQIKKMKDGSCLTGVVRKFADLDLDPARVSNHAMGYMFEEIIRRFSENAEAGDHYTPREVIRLMTRLALAEGSEDLLEPGKVIKVADVACGTGGMLSTAQAELAKLAPKADVYLYGQEILPESYSICLADMLIKGQRADNIRNADTMKEDCFPDDKFRIELINPPFGQPWGGKDAHDGVEAAVKQEHERYHGRFPWGLPATSDMQLLFMQHVVYKLDDERGRACVISNGLPLFSGSTKSGESQIRRGLLENDLVEAIVGLPTDLFYNTGIGIYVWVISKNKRPERRGRVQLIDATDVWTPMRRSMGNKRKMLSDEQIEQIVDVYSSFEESGRSRILPNEEFLYREYSVFQPLQRDYAITDDRIDDICAGKFTENMHNPAKLEKLQAIDVADRTKRQEADLEKLTANEPVFERMIAALRANISDEVTYDESAFKKRLKKTLTSAGVTLDAGTLVTLVDRLSRMNKNAPLRKNREGYLILDNGTKDKELVKLSESVEDYMEREVLPYVPDAQWVGEDSQVSIYSNGKMLSGPALAAAKEAPVGAEIPFTRYFYRYEAPESSDILLDEFMRLENQLEKELEGLVEA